jgi:hypothetical protein
MLNAHREITFPPETHFIRTYLSRQNSIDNAIEEEMFNDVNLLKLKLPLKKIIGRNSDLSDLYIDLLQEYMLKRKKKYVGDKDPKNIEYMQLLYNFFPQAIVIHIYRDPRAVIASRMKAEWSKGRPLWQHILAYKVQLNYGRDKGRGLFDNYIEIKYERLVEDPERELKRLCDLLGFKYDPDMVEFYKSAGDVVQGKEVLWKQNCFNPIMLQNIDKWKKHLTEKQIDIIEFVLCSEMNLLGYDRIYKKRTFRIFYKQFYKLFIEAVGMIYRFKLN